MSASSPCNMERRFELLQKMTRTKLFRLFCRAFLVLNIYFFSRFYAATPKKDAPRLLTYKQRKAGRVSEKNENAVDEYVGNNEPTCCGVVGMIRSAIGATIGDRVLLVEERDTSAEIMFYDERVKMFKRIK